MPDHSSRFSFTQKIRPGHLAVNGALKTMFVFHCGKIPAKAGLMQQAEQGICNADLILLTHAGCAFKDPRGRFGISAPGLRSARNKAQRQGNEISENQSWRRPDVPHFFCKSRIHFLQVRTAALRSNRRYGAAALLHCGAKVPQISASKAQKNAYLYRSTRRVRCS